MFRPGEMILNVVTLNMEDSTCHTWTYFIIMCTLVMRNDSQDLLDSNTITFGSVSHLETTPGTGIVHLGYSTKPLTLYIFQETEHVF